MTINYKWEPLSVKVDNIEDNTDVIVECVWAYSGTDAETEASHRLTGRSTFEVGNTFIEFASVTEADLTGWIEATQDEVEISLMQERISNKIAETNTPVSTVREVSLPWTEEVPSANTGG